MPVVARIEPIEHDIDMIISQALSPAAQSAALADFARAQKTEALAIDEEVIGKPVPVETFVDGVAGMSENAVRPTGQIVYEFELATDMLSWISEQLATHSPVKTGRYQKSHILLADGVEVDPLGKVPPAGEYVFTSTSPYARKIEGSDNRAPESASAPDGVFEAVAALAQRRFGNIAKIAFAWRSLRGAAALDAWASSQSAQALGRRRHTTDAKRQDWLTRQPAIVVTMR